ncbi:multidrug resistance protein MdtH [Candidatus Protofrankia californiensis]|uniref:Multidrug resistance protein MdtH n=1 Tax=Candidatus Protofrankia californiensis TaxID=1839754 RepID=A0A1C3PG28_9ACTN|nr:multidrug resistance protein MdtH [Candidatus Protofrankia californiensis]
MKATLTQVRSFSRPIQLLLLNQLAINVGFYMLMPYLANYLAGTLGLAAWLVGFILGVRNFSQQGMFLLGGSLADRLGYKQMIVAGLALRTIGFGLLGFAGSLPALLVASATIGFAGALFNPAVRAYLSHEAGTRQVEAFAVFNVFYQLGILLGPLLGLALAAVEFRLVCLVAAGLFLALTMLQIRALPPHTGQHSGTTRALTRDWQEVLANRPFLLFSLAMIGSYVLTFQVYLGLPLEIRRLTGSELGVMLLFALSGLLTVLGQLRVTAWAKARWTPAQALQRGLGLMGLSFLPLALTAPFTAIPAASNGSWSRMVLVHAVGLTPILLSAMLLALATMIVYPFEMATIVTLGNDRLIGTYYGLYNTLCGIGIAIGNLLTGVALDAGRRAGLPSLPWTLLALAGAGCAWGIHRLDHNDRLTRQPSTPDVESAPTQLLEPSPSSSPQAR